MSEGSESLRRKIASAGDLQSVVRTMKALAAANIAQYEQSVRALADYDRTIQLGLGACIRQSDPLPSAGNAQHSAVVAPVHVVVFGSDQGLVGQFNDAIAEFVLRALQGCHGVVRIWAVGERVHDRLVDAGQVPVGLFGVPTTVEAITPLVGQLQIEAEVRWTQGTPAQLWVFHHRPCPGARYEPALQKLLPIDAAWRLARAQEAWPTHNRPEIMDSEGTTPRALIREYLFISLYRACAESLASENASRLAAMERAEKNIDELLGQLQLDFQQMRQAAIDEELFDVVSGFEALTTPKA